MAFYQNEAPHAAEAAARLVVVVDHDEGDDDDNDDDDGAALKAWWRQREQKRHERRVKNVAMFDAYFEMRQRCGDLILNVDAKGAWSFVSNGTGGPNGRCSCGAVPKFRPGIPPQDRGRGLPACELRLLEQQWLTPRDKKWLDVGLDVICNKAHTHYAAKALYELLLGELLAARLHCDDGPRAERYMDVLLQETLMASRPTPSYVPEPRVWEKIWRAVCAYHSTT